MKAEEKSKIQNPKSKMEIRERVESERTAIWVMWIIVAAGVVIRLPQLGYSFYGDEGFSLLRDSSKFLTDSEDRFRPLFFSLLYLWKQLGFSGEIGLRLLPLLFGIAQMPLAFLIGRELKNTSLALAFTTLIAASPMLIEFSQELRMYSMVTTIAMLQVWLFLKILRPPPTPPKTGGERILWILFTVTALAGVYTHLFYWLFLFGILTWIVREREAIRLRDAMISFAAMGLLYLPNIPNLLKFASQRGGEYGFHAPSAIPKLLAAFTVGFNYFSLPEQGAGREIGWSTLADNFTLVMLAGFAGLIILWRMIWMHTESTERRFVWVCHELFTIPLLLAAIASYISNKYFLQPKYVIFCAPFLLLMIANSFLTVRMAAARRVLAAAGTAILAISLIHFWTPTEYGRRENWRGIAEILTTTNPKDTAIVLLPGRYALLYYYAPQLQGRLPTITIPLSREAEVLLQDQLFPIFANRKSVYYIRHDISQNIEDPDDQLPAVIGTMAEINGVSQFNPRLRLYDWKLPEASAAEPDTETKE